jgi:hypothetical protein
VPVVIAFVVLVAFGWWVTAQDPFSAASTVGVLVAGLALIIFATVWRRRAAPIDGARDHEDAHRPGGMIVWVALVTALVAWELTTLFSHPREAHPTISSISDPLQSQHLVRWLLFGGWLALGWVLAT